MRTLPTYGMAGIGIAAAIGFIFALSFLVSNSSNISDQGDLKNEPSSSSKAAQDGNDGAATLFSRSNNAGATDENLSLSRKEATSTLFRPTLESIAVTDTSSQESSELVPNMQFESHKAVLIRAKFTNQNDGPVENHTITLNIKKDEPAQTRDQAASFRGDIGAHVGIELDLYWDPDTPGDYTLLIFSSTSSSEPEAPESTIPLRVVAAS
jgi:hypothetical protein